MSVTSARVSDYVIGILTTHVKAKVNRPAVICKLTTYANTVICKIPAFNVQQHANFGLQLCAIMRIHKWTIYSNMRTLDCNHTQLCGFTNGQYTATYVFQITTMRNYADSQMNNMLQNADLQLQLYVNTQIYR